MYLEIRRIVDVVDSFVSKLIFLLVYTTFSRSFLGYALFTNMHVII